MTIEAEKLAEVLDIFSSTQRNPDNAASRAAALIRRQAEQIKELRGALERCADWMERLRASGDAGFFDWEEGDEYTQARSALAATKEAE